MNGNCCKHPQRMKHEYLDDLVGRVCATYEDACGINHIEGYNLPRQEEIRHIIDLCQEVVFPGFERMRAYSFESLTYSIGNMINDLYTALHDQVGRAFRYRAQSHDCADCSIHEMVEEAVVSFLDAIPEIRQTMKLDVEAAFVGDPAAISLDEIVVSYPGVRAITIQRFAHRLYQSHVPLIPRMMTEYAHSITGIDIHPGAKLGKGIFIDHGTGVVIGETAVIGDNVRIYQGVTLGALSFPKDACGMLIKGAKRHPTIENDVTIYAGATVLGDIVVGKGTVIGGNVWLTESLPPGTKISMAKPEQTVRLAKKA